MLSTRTKLALGSAMGTVGSLALVAASHAQDFAASTTAAIEDARDAITQPFFDNIGIIVVAVASITIVLWAIGWFFGLFRRRR